jgi:cyclic nucleotide-binding protein
MSRRKLAEGDVLCDAGEISEHIYFPRSGMIAIRVPTRDGTGVEVATVGHEGAAAFNTIPGAGTARVPCARCSTITCCRSAAFSAAS